MGRHDRGPQRSASVNAYLRETRVLAALALLALAGALVSDELAGHFWSRHALLAGLAASVIVVMFSAAIINEAIDRRRRRRWSVLAQHVMFELVRNARMTWTGIIELAGAIPPDAPAQGWLQAGAEVVSDTPRLHQAVRRLVDDGHSRQVLREGIAGLVEHNDEVIGRWAAVMLNVDFYAEVIDRHVELANEIMWLGSVLDADEPPEDEQRRHRARSSVAAQLEHAADDDWLTDRLVAIAELAEQLDRTTLQIALRIVPIEWWEERLGTTVPPELRAAVTNS